MAGSDRVHVGTVEDLHESATRLTGLSDFGPDDYTDGLAVILESYARDGGLTPLGSKVARVGLRGALAARLMAEAAWQAHPEHAAVPVDRPIFVTGLPGERTNAVSELHTDNGVLMKPFDPSELLRAIAAATAADIGKNAA